MKRVAIVGGSPLTRGLAPHDDESWEIWVLGNQIDRYADKRVNVVFEVHDNLSEHGKINEYKSLLISEVKKRNALLVTGEKWEHRLVDYDWAVYPEEQIKTLLDGNFLTSSPAYMMGMAILQGADEIGIYGVEMAVDDHEYFKQRAGMYAWIAYAKAKGIKVTIPSNSALFKEAYIEGKHWNNPDVISGTPPFTEAEFNKIAAIHEQSMAECSHEITLLQAKHQTHNGAVQVYKRLAKIARALEAGAKVTNLTDSMDIK